MKTQAFVCKSQGAPFKLQDVELDSPLPREVLVQIVACGVCATDTHCAHGVFPSPFPTIFGHESSGKVIEVGSEVTRVKPGDSVLLSFASCGKCVYCKNGRSFGCPAIAEINFGRLRPDVGAKPCARDDDGEIYGSFFGQSGFAKHALVSESSCVKVPSDTDLVMMAPLGCGLQTGSGAVLNFLKPSSDKSIAVWGAGAVGMSAVWAAVVLGLKTIIVVDLADTRLSLAREFGATHAFNGKDPQLVEKIIRATNELGVDCAVEATGVHRVLKTAFSAVAPCGHLVSCGTPGPGYEPPFEIHDMVNSSRTYSGLCEGASHPPVYIPELIELHKQGKFPIERIAKVYSIDQMDEAIKDMASGEVIKPIIKFSDA